MIKKWPVLISLAVMLVFGSSGICTATTQNPSPEKVLQSYFVTLQNGSNLTNIKTNTGSIGAGLEPYTKAYSYWSKDWQKKNSYDNYLASWEGTVNVKLLKLLPAGGTDSQKRFFVETENIEFTKDKPRTGIFYYTGYFTMTKTKNGWFITDGKFEPEDLSWELGGHQPWRGDPVSVAIVDGLGLSIDSPPGKPVSQTNPNGTTTVKFIDSKGKVIHTVNLYLPKSAYWLVLNKT